MKHVQKKSLLSSITQEVKLHIQARYPLIYLVTWEEKRVIEDISKIAVEDDQRKKVYTWKKFFAVLCNQDSFSNAEIFSHSVKTLDLAKVIGVETNGSVISTDGTTLLDGSYFRIPMRGWYVYTTGENMEARGAVPDYIVENPPEIWEKEGKDLQVEKAVQVLLEELKKKKGEPEPVEW